MKLVQKDSNILWHLMNIFDRSIRTPTEFSHSFQFFLMSNNLVNSLALNSLAFFIVSNKICCKINPICKLKILLTANKCFVKFPNKN